MDEVAENGLAAHWRYKGVRSGEETAQEWLDRLRGVIDGMDMNSSSLSLDKDLAMDSMEVFVFTPTGDIRKLREGATILDFAYDIHSDIGNKCIAGKINHRNATIRDTLSSGDLVEIITSKNQTPRADWLNIVVTSKAKSRIKAYLREAEQKEFMNGKEELERKLKNWKLGLDLDTAVVTLCKYLKLKSGVELYRKIATNELPISEIKVLITRHVSGEPLTKQTEERAVKVKQEKKSNKDLLIVGNNLQGMQYKFAQCCTPLYGDEIFGFVTILNGITIHRKNCINARQMQERYPYRVIDAVWQGSEKVGKQEVTIDLQGDDSISVEAVRSITKSIGIELRSITSEYHGDKMRTTVKINVTDKAVVDSVLYLFKQLDGVKKAKTV
ncbi:MAG: TGS domain-containing protein [Rikenellaceae bacterium]